MKSQGFFQTPQDIMEKYNGCSVPQYTAYRRVNCLHKVLLADPPIFPPEGKEIKPVHEEPQARFFFRVDNRAFSFFSLPCCYL